MINVDMKALIKRLNLACTTGLEAAAGLCVNRGHYEVTVEHFLLRLLEQPLCDFSLILRNFEIDPGRMGQTLERDLEEYPTGNQGRPTFSPRLLELFQDAWTISSVEFGEGAIRSGAILLAFLAKPNVFATGHYVDFLTRIPRDQLRRDFPEVAKVSAESDMAPAGGGGGAAPAGAPGGGPRGESALEKFCTDFTARAAQGEIDPVFGRDGEIRQMIDIFARRRKNNPIVVGEAGVGKTAVVEGLAVRVAEGDVPDILKDVRILGLDMGLLSAGAGVKGEFENRLKNVISEVKASPKPIILFIDEAHTLIGAGGNQGGGDAANLLKPALARGELRTVAATTWSEYKKYFEKDAALARRFQLVKLDEPDEETAALILRGLKEKYESAHGVAIRDDAIVQAAELAGRYISGRQLPDKAVDLLDTAAARVKILLTAKPSGLEDLERCIQALERQRDAIHRDKLHGRAAVDGEALAEVEAELARVREDAARVEEEWKTQQEAARKIVAIRQALEGRDEEEKTGIAAEEERGAQAPADAAATEEAEPAEGEKAEGETPDAAEDAGGESEGGEESADENPWLGKPRAELEGALAASLEELECLQKENAWVHIEVDPDIVAKVVSDWTGIPVGKMLRDEAQAVMDLDRNLKKRIRGQNHAIDAISQVLRASKTGLRDPSQPLGVFLLVGPSGVGKTETALALADQLFGGERNVVTVNMSEFQEKHTVSRLIGSPPGYVGYGEGGLLTEAVRQKPYSAVLLDETEKAHPEVLNLFYQVFDKGMLSDGEGREIPFQNTVIFLTSNLASDVVTRMTLQEPQPSAEQVVEAIRPVLSDHFKPALLARMTIVPYFSLPKDAMKEIVMLKLDQLAQRMQENNGAQLAVTAEVVQKIADRCTEVDTGARNIDHILRGTVLPDVSQKVLECMTEGRLPEKVQLKLAGDGGIAVEIL